MATMKDIIQSPLPPALFGSMALGLFASSASGSKVVSPHALQATAPCWVALWASSSS